MTLELYEGCSLFAFKKQNLTLAISVSSQSVWTFSLSLNTLRTKQLKTDGTERGGVWAYNLFMTYQAGSSPLDFPILCGRK